MPRKDRITFHRKYLKRMAELSEFTAVFHRAGFLDSNSLFVLLDLQKAENGLGPTCLPWDFIQTQSIGLYPKKVSS